MCCVCVVRVGGGNKQENETTVIAFNSVPCLSREIKNKCNQKTASTEVINLALVSYVFMDVFQYYLQITACNWKCTQ